MAQVSFLQSHHAWRDPFIPLSKHYDRLIGSTDNMDKSERDIATALDRVTAFTAFCFSVKMYRLRVYQRYLTKNGIIALLPWIVGIPIWTNHKPRILNALGLSI